MASCFINIADIEAAARAKLPDMVWDFYSGGAQDEITLRENRAAWQRLSLRYRVMRNVTGRDLGVTVLNHRIDFPVIVPPMAFQGLAHPDAELATVRAAGAMGTIMMLSMLSNSAMEDVVAASSGPVWLQLYLQKDRNATKALVARAEAAGCTGLAISVDSPCFGRQERNLRNGFQLPRDLLVRNLLPRRLERLPRGMTISQDLFEDRLDPSITWRDLEWLCSSTRLPVLVKGVIRGDDAVLAVDHGARGVIVSNHGGRQLDTAPATGRVLEEIVTSVAGRCDVLVDGGIRRGTDVVKALALGAKAVLMGRPVLWGLAAAGESGVHAALNILRQEFDNALALCGCACVNDIGRDLVLKPEIIEDHRRAATAGESIRL
jgi:4-hydroxymandelate oxidase